MKCYGKAVLDHDAMIALFRERKLIITDEYRIKRHLAHVSYYRLTGYANAYFDRASNSFIPNTTYDSIWELYKFDRKLRLLTLDAVERIEVSARTVLSDVMSLKHGHHWFEIESLYKKPAYHKRFCKTLEQECGKNSPKRRNEIIKHFYDTYSDSLPPSWMVMECLSMGAWTLALGSLLPAEQNAVAVHYGLKGSEFSSWLSSLAWVRNVCAHHGRLWNRVNERPPRKLIFPKCPPMAGTANSSFYGSTVIMVFLLKKIVRHSTWVGRLKKLFADYPSVDKSRMGFPENWDNHPFWK